MFCLLLHPPLWGKGKCSDTANFGQASLRETGLSFLSKMHSSEFQWEKARRKKRTEHLEGQAGMFVKCGWVVLTFLRLSWRNCWSYWDFLMWERSRAGFSWEQRAGVLTARWQEVEWQLAGVQPRVRDCPLEHRSTPGWEGDEQRSPFWKLLCQSFGLGVTLIHRLSKVRFFWLRGGKHDTILGLLVLRWEGLQLWGSLEIQLWCAALLLAQVSGAGLYLHC